MVMTCMLASVTSIQEKSTFAALASSQAEIGELSHRSTLFWTFVGGGVEMGVEARMANRGSGEATALTLLRARMPRYVS